MSNEYVPGSGSGSTKDNEQRSFKADQNGDAARNICSAQLDDVVDAINNKEKVTKTTPTVYNVTCAAADTEYSQALSANVSAFTMRSRGREEMRYGFASGATNLPSTYNITQAAGLAATSFANASVFVGQTFLAVGSGFITKITLPMKIDSGSPAGTFNMVVQGVTANKPDGVTVGTSGNVDITSITVDGTYYDVDFIFTTPIAVSAAQALSFYVDTSGVTNYATGWTTRRDNSFNPYANGRYVQSFDSGATWPIGDNFQDLSFNIEIQTTDPSLVYMTLRGTAVYSEDNLDSTGLVLYFQSSEAGMIVEITEWV